MAKNRENDVVVFLTGKSGPIVTRSIKKLSQVYHEAEHVFAPNTQIKYYFQASEGGHDYIFGTHVRTIESQYAFDYGNERQRHLRFLAIRYMTELMKNPAYKDRDDDRLCNKYKVFLKLAGISLDEFDFISDLTDWMGGPLLRYNDLAQMQVADEGSTEFQAIIRKDLSMVLLVKCRENHSSDAHQRSLFLYAISENKADFANIISDCAENMEFHSDVSKIVVKDYSGSVAKNDEAKLKMYSQLHFFAKIKQHEVQLPSVADKSPANNK